MSDRQRFNDITQRHLARLRSNLNDRSVDRIEADQSPLQVSPDVGGEQSDQLLVVEARGHELLSCDLWKFQYNIVFMYYYMIYYYLIFNDQLIIPDICHNQHNR